MPQLMRVRSTWSGFPGAPGFTNLYFRDFPSEQPLENEFTPADAAAATNRVAVFWTAVRNVLPTIVRVTVDPNVDVIEDTTGELQTTLLGNNPDPFAGVAAGVYSAASGGVINWRTAGVRNGRRVRGRSFIVPMTGGQYAADGQLAAASQTILQNAATALADSTQAQDLHVWARPTAVSASDGASFIVNAAQVPRLGAVLRSRRD